MDFFDIENSASGQLAEDSWEEKFEREAQKFSAEQELTAAVIPQQDFKPYQTPSSLESAASRLGRGSEMPTQSFKSYQTPSNLESMVSGFNNTPDVYPQTSIAPERPMQGIASAAVPEGGFPRAPIASTLADPELTSENFDMERQLRSHINYLSANGQPATPEQVEGLRRSYEMISNLSPMERLRRLKALEAKYPGINYRGSAAGGVR